MTVNFVNLTAVKNSMIQVNILIFRKNFLLHCYYVRQSQRRNDFIAHDYPHAAWDRLDRHMHPPAFETCTLGRVQPRFCGSQ